MLDLKTRNAIIAGMRRVWHRHPTRLAVLKAAEIRTKQVKKDGTLSTRPLVFYTCAQCGNLGKSQESAEYKKIAVDHISPIIPINGTQLTLDQIAERMFCDVSGCQVLCSACHHTKTQIENQTRREARKCSLAN
jgi:5-methylcytosine-specific restriction endonuclease McrA